MSERPWRAVDGDLFRFTTTELRDLHVAVMSAFERAAVLAPTLNLEAVRRALATVEWDEPVTDERLLAALASLVDWHLLEATQDHAAHYATPEEFERRNLRWSLTPRGEAAVTGVLAALDSLRHAVGLQPAVLDAIGDALNELIALGRQPPTPEADAAIHLRLAEVESHLAGLVVSVRQFNGQLQRLVRDDHDDDELFVEVKRRTVTYLEEFVDGVERPQRRIATALAELTDSGLSSLFDRAARGANLAPVAGGDPTPEWIAARSHRWGALMAWFFPTGGDRPQVDGLLDVARSAIIELLRVLERRWDERRRSASVADDFRALANLFDAAPSDTEAHRLFGAAFGLWSARHAHLAPVDGELRRPNHSWSVTEPVEVAPALRTTGSLANRGRPRPVADPARWRTDRLVAQTRALADHDALIDALVTDGCVPLSTFADLDRGEFTELLGLLSAALDAPPATDGTRRSLSTDGQVEIVLHPADSHTTLVLPHGWFRGPDFDVAISLVGAPAPATRRRALA